MSQSPLSARLGRVPKALAVVVAVALAGCSDDTLARRRSDAGLGPEDAGDAQPLPLSAGMTFTYRAVLTFRDTNNEELNAQYTLALRIAEVDDQGSAGDSTLTLVAIDASTTDDNWDAQRDFDSWVGRLGPSLSGDRVGTDPVTAELSRAPEMPPMTVPTVGKVLPKSNAFFIDVRRIDTISRAFLDGHAAQGPSLVAPAQNGGRWRLAFAGLDDRIVYYPSRAKTRAIALEYDVRGFLARLEETIGDAASPPAATCRLELTQGP